VAIFGVPPLDPTNTSFSLGTPNLAYPGKRVQIVSVQPLMSPNIELIAAYAVWPRDSMNRTSSGGFGFPDPGYPRHHPLTEVIPAAETSYVRPDNPTPIDIRITIGFRVRSGDIGAVNGVLVTYKVNGDTHQKFFAHAVVACVKPNPCRGPDDDRHWDEEVLYNLGLAPKP